MSKLKNDVKDTIKAYLPINELYVGSYGTKKCDRKPMNESKNNSNKNVIEGILNSMVLPEYEHVICDIKVKDPSERGYDRWWLVAWRSGIITPELDAGQDRRTDTKFKPKLKPAQRVSAPY